MKSRYTDWGTSAENAENIDNDKDVINGDQMMDSREARANFSCGD